jgi:hypothetical protein
LQNTTSQLYKHYKPDTKAVVYSLANHFDKASVRASKLSNVDTASMITETSPDQKKDQTKHELDYQENKGEQNRGTFGPANTAETIMEVNER